MKYLVVGCICFAIGLATAKADKAEVILVKAKVQRIIQNPNCHIGRMK